MNTAVAPIYVTRAGEVEQDRADVLAIRAAGHPDADTIARDTAKYDWFYRHCPYGEPLLQLLQHAPSNSCVGMAAAGTRRLLWRGQEIQAGVLVDLMVTPEHRSLGPALMLQTSLMERGRQQFQLLYGFPNPKAAPVFKRVGYAHWIDAVRYACVLRHAGYLRRRMPQPLAALLGAALDATQRTCAALRRLRAPALGTQWSDEVDPRMDELWARSPHGDGLVGVRDSAFLRWRFQQAPRPRTRFLLISEPDGRLCAWFACQDDNGFLHVRDFWSDDAASGIRRARIDALLSAAYAQGHTAVSFEFAGSDQRMTGWLQAGFQARARRPLFGLWSSLPEGFDAARDLHVTSGDEDEDA